MQTPPCLSNELFTADKATGTSLRKRPTRWKARQTEDVKRRVSGREEGKRENVVCVLGGAEEGGGRPGTPSN